MTDYLLILIISFCGMISDIKSRRISNRQLLISFFSCFIYFFIFKGFRYSIISLVYMLIPFVTFYPAFVVRLIGSGDIKLMMLLSYVLGLYKSCDLIFLILVLGVFFLLLCQVFKLSDPPFSVPIFAGLQILFFINYSKSLLGGPL